MHKSVKILLASIVVYLILVYLIYYSSGAPSFNCFLYNGLLQAAVMYSQKCKAVNSFTPFNKGNENRRMDHGEKGGFGRMIPGRDMMKSQYNPYAQAITQ